MDHTCPDCGDSCDCWCDSVDECTHCPDPDDWDERDDFEEER